MAKSPSKSRMKHLAVNDKTDMQHKHKRKKEEAPRHTNVSDIDPCGHKYTCFGVYGCSADTFTIVKEAELHGIDETKAQAIPFSSLLVTLREVSVVRVMKRLLDRLYAIGANGICDITDGQHPKRIGIEPFLTSYMVAFHSRKVFESLGPLEHTVTLKAVTMLQVVGSMRRNIMEKTSMRRQTTDARGLYKAIFEYMQAFDSWKSTDERKLLVRMKHEIEALFCIEKQLDVNDVQTSIIYKELQVQQKRIIGNAYRVAGEYGVTELDQVRQSIMGGAIGPLFYTTLDDESDDCQQSSMDSVLPASLTNEEITHEILLDGMFQMDVNGRPLNENPIYSKIRESIDVSFFRGLEDDLRLTPPLHARCVEIIMEIKNNLDGLKFETLAGSSYPLLDMEVMEDELMCIDTSQEPTVSWHRYLQVIRCLSDGLKDAYAGCIYAPSIDDPTSMLTSMQTTLQTTMESLIAASDDKSIQPKLFIQALRDVMGLVKKVCVMATNGRIRSISHVLKNRGPQYLLNATNRKIDNKTITLEVTGVYIVDAIKTEIAAKRVDIQDLVQNKVGTTAAYNNVMAAVLLQSFFGCSTSATLPETLHLDHGRLSVIHRRFELYTVVIAAIGIINACLRDKKIQEAPEILQELGKCLLQSTLRTLDTKGRIVEMVETLSHHVSEETAACIGDCLTKNLVVGSAVFNLTSTRMKNIVFHALHGTTVNMFSGLIPSVVAAIGDELGLHINVLRQVLRVNLLVYATHYNRIIQEKAIAMWEQ